MKILIIDNNLHIPLYPQSLLIRACLGTEYFWNTKICKPTELSDKDISVDRVILTGSTAFIRQNQDWMNKEIDFVEKCMKLNIPVLGICFGAQLLAKHIFGEKSIVALPFPINGSVSVEYKGNCPLFKGLPNPLGVMSTHYEGFIVPEEYTIAKTLEWPCYGFFHSENVYGIQFHPELSGEIGKLLIRLQRNLYDRNVYLEFSVKTFYKYGKKIINNFILLNKGE